MALTLDHDSAGIALDEQRREQFAEYLRLLIAWNDRFNLTGISDSDQIQQRLFLDGLRLIPVIDQIIAREPSVHQTRLIDIGSGAGFPGLVLAIARPDLAVTLVEATGKKVNFLEAVIAELGLANTSAIHARAEDIGRDLLFRDWFDLATARAVAALPVLLELAAPVLRIGGTALFPKGLDLGPELAAGQRAAIILNMRCLDAGRLADSETRLVRAIKTGPTPHRYPRRPGIPAKSPIG